jgi:hypothetical protein
LLASTRACAVALALGRLLRLVAQGLDLVAQCRIVLLQLLELRHQVGQPLVVDDPLDPDQAVVYVHLLQVHGILLRRHHQAAGERQGRDTGEARAHHGRTALALTARKPVLRGD